ncbi:MAG: ArnT family glycosyltransferase [Promethearchaeota archaeon]
MENPLNVLKRYLGPITLGKILLVIVLGLAILLRCWNLQGVPRFSYDEGNYADISENTANGRFMEWSHSFYGPTFWNLPLFFILVAFSFRLFGSGIFQARAVSALFGTLTCYLAYRFGKDILNKEKVGLLAAGLYAIDIYAVSIDRLALLDTTQSFFIALSILFWYLNYKRNKQTYTIIAGISAGLAILTKATGAFAILILFVSTLINALNGKSELEQSLRCFIILLGTCILTVSPYLIFARLSDPSVFQKMLSMYFLRSQRGESQGIYYFALSIRSNPLIFGFGFVGLIYSIIMRKREESLLFLPWILAPTMILLSANRLPLRYLSPLFLPLTLATSSFIISILIPFKIRNKRMNERILEVFANPRILLSVLIAIIVLIGLFNTLNRTSTIFTSKGDYEPQQVAEYLDLYVEENAVIVGNPAIDFLSKKHVFHDMQTLIENAERHGDYTLYQPLIRKLDYLILDPEWKYGWGISPELQEFLEGKCVLERAFGDTDLYRVL